MEANAKAALEDVNNNNHNSTSTTSFSTRDREQYIVLQYIAIGIAIVLYRWGGLKVKGRG